MSFSATAWAWSQPTPSATSKLVLLAIAEVANQHTRRCCPSVRYLCRMTQLSDRAVRVAVRELRDASIITTEVRQRPDGGQSTHQINLPDEAFTAFDPPASAAPPPAPGASPPAPRAGHEPGIQPAKPSPPPAAPRAKPKKSLPPDWTPDDSTRASLDRAGIPEAMWLGWLDEFRLYWTEKGEARPSWGATFLNHAKRERDRAQLTARTAPKVDQATAAGAEFRGKHEGDLLAEAVAGAFATLSARYGAKFGKVDGDPNAREAWLRDLRADGVTPERLRYALDQTRALEWPPSIGELLKASQITPEKLGLPSARHAYDLARARRWAHPIVALTAQRVGYDHVATGQEAETWPAFRTAYSELVHRVLAGEQLAMPDDVPLATPPPRAPNTVTPDRLAALKDAARGRRPTT